MTPEELPLMTWVSYRTSHGTTERARCGPWAEGYVAKHLGPTTVQLRVRTTAGKYRQKSITIDRLHPHDKSKHPR